ncbi:hypothetical protein RFI_37956, partial [Reticulomyxa filosa]
MARTPNLAINNGYNGSNPSFPTYRAPIKKNGDSKYIQHHRPGCYHQHEQLYNALQFDILQVASQLVSNTFRLCSFFFTTFFLNTKKKNWTGTLMICTKMTALTHCPISHVGAHFGGINGHNGSAPALCGSSAVSAKKGFVQNTTDEQSSCKSVVMPNLFCATELLSTRHWSIQQHIVTNMVLSSYFLFYFCRYNNNNKIYFVVV